MLLYAIIIIDIVWWYSLCHYCCYSYYYCVWSDYSLTLLLRWNWLRIVVLLLYYWPILDCIIGIHYWPVCDIDIIEMTIKDIIVWLFL